MGARCYPPLAPLSLALLARKIPNTHRGALISGSKGERAGDLPARAAGRLEVAMGREAAIGAVAPWLHQIRCPHIPKTGGATVPGLVVQSRHPSPALLDASRCFSAPPAQACFPSLPASASTRPRTHPPAGLCASSASCSLPSHPSAGCHRCCCHRVPTACPWPLSPEPYGVRAAGGGAALALPLESLSSWVPRDRPDKAALCHALCRSGGVCPTSTSFFRPLGGAGDECE